MDDPKLIILFSGKRKSGKDYICEKLEAELGQNQCTIIRISEPLKRLYAKNHGLDLKELLSDGPYKEKYRLDMINWSDEIRRKDSGYFCEAACSSADKKPVWIVSDIRRKTDIEWFKKTYGDKIKTVRVEAELKTREKRGWIFTPGVDDAVSECNLDDITDWDSQICNNSKSELLLAIETIKANITI